MSAEKSLYKNIENQIDVEQPWNEDVLERKKVAQKLTNAIKTITQPFVISIEAPFGGGKTFFLTRWYEQLKNDGYSVVYFNAWETDYANDSLMAFLDEIESSFLNSDDKKVKEAKAAGKALLKNIALNSVEAATLGVVKKDDFEKAQQASEQVQINRMKAFSETKKSIEKFKKKLGEYGNDLRDKDENNRPIIIFIDELDRCRPNYAIELLENIKHLFNIPNYVFVLGVDRCQLISSASAIYGNNLNGEGYIRKFIDFNYNLPEPSTQKYINSLYNKFSLGEVCSQDNSIFRGGSDLVKHFSNLAEFFNLSLREQEQLFTTLNFTIRVLFTERQLLFNPLLCLLLILKEKEPELYRKYCTQQEQEQLVFNYFCSLPNGKEFLYNKKTGATIYTSVLIGAARFKSYIIAKRDLLIKKINQPEYSETDEDKHLKQIYSWAVNLMETMDFEYGLDGFVANFLYRCIEDKDIY